MSCSTSTCGQMEEIRIKIIYWQLCNSVVTLRYYLFICLSDYIIDTVDNIRFFYLKRRSSNKKKTWKIFKVCCKTAWEIKFHNFDRSHAQELFQNAYRYFITKTFYGLVLLCLNFFEKFIGGNLEKGEFCKRQLSNGQLSWYYFWIIIWHLETSASWLDPYFIICYGRLCFSSFIFLIMELTFMAWNID